MNKPDGVISIRKDWLRRGLLVSLAFLLSACGTFQPASQPPKLPKVKPMSAAMVQAAMYYVDRTPLMRSRLLVPFHGTVQAIFFHPLVVYPQLAFDGDSLSQGYQDWFITVTEFTRMLPQLYANNYILISPYDLFSLQTVNGKTVVVPSTLWVPPGKKPLLLSIDDLNYYNYMRANGNCYRLVLDAKGNVATDCYTPSGKEVISEGNGIVPILNQFVAKHPGFSLDGAKGMINETGYEGVLGYRTQPGSPDRQQQIAEAIPVIKKLKATGWVFASHSWGHRNDAQISYGDFVWDTQQWINQVEPLLGPTPFYVYPFGATVPSNSTKMQYLISQGFHMFFGVGPTPYWQWYPNFVTLDRVHVDGMALMTQQRILAPFFNAYTVVDYQERGLKPPAGQ